MGCGPVGLLARSLRIVREMGQNCPAQPRDVRLAQLLIHDVAVGASTSVNGTGAGMAGSNAACSPYTSDVANRRFGCEACCAWRNCSTAARSAGSFTDTETNSRLRGWYIRYVVSRWELARARRTPRCPEIDHQQLAGAVLPQPLQVVCAGHLDRDRRPLEPGQLCVGPRRLDRPFTAHPTGSVRSTATGRPASSASMASRASRDLTRSSRALSSMRP